MYITLAHFIVYLSYQATDAVWLKEMEEAGGYQGDMILDPEEQEMLAKAGNAFASIINGKWKDGVIPYVIDDDLKFYAPMKAIKAAIADYHKYTCLKFKERTDEREYVRFYRGSGCSSPVGWKKYRVNDVSIGYGCYRKEAVMHELGHSIGLHHEQCRPDRDQYVTIQPQNMVKGGKHNFNIEKDTESHGTNYDYLSMMHYDQYAFSKQPYKLKTMITKDPKFQNIIGWAKGFSETDKVQINKMYQCGSEINAWMSNGSSMSVNPLIPNVTDRIETSQLICNANQLTGFYMMGNIGR